MHLWEPLGGHIALEAMPEFLESDFYKTHPLVHQAIVQMVVAGSYDDETEIIRNSKLPVGAQEQIHDLSYLNMLELPVWQKSPLLIPDAGHLVQWGNSDVVNQWLYTFVNDHMTRK